MNHTSICKNCGNNVSEEQKFCPNCGQKTDTHKINFHFLLHEIQHGIFHVDKGILFTIKELFLRPGFTIKEYVEGKRKSHFPPVTFIMILGALASFLNKFLNNHFVNDEFDIKHNQLTPENKAIITKIKFLLDNYKTVAEWINHHFAIFMLLVIPFIALGIYLAFKKYKRYNYAESLVISTFIVGQSLVIYIITLPLRKINESLNGIGFYVMFGMFVFTLIQIFNDKPFWKVMIRSLLSIFFVWLIIMLSGLLLGIYIIYKFL